MCFGTMSMAKLIELEEGVFVAGQLEASDFAEIAARGFRSVVDNRPDGEVEDQLPHEAAQAAAQLHGMEFRYEPVMNVDVTDDEPVETFAQSLADLPRPVLFYCRTGTRCTYLWAQANAERLGPDSAVKIAARAGYDLEPIRVVLEERAGLVVA